MTQPDETAPTRPARSTAAATLACLQGGLTSVTTILVLAGAGGEDGPAELPVGIAQAVGVALLIVGAWWLMRGKGRSLLLVGWVLQLVLCLYYVIGYAASDSGGPGLTGVESGGLIGVAVLFAVMPVIGLVLVTSEQTGGTSDHGGDRVAAALLAFVQAGSTLVVTGILMVGLLLADVDVDVEPTQSTDSANVATPVLSTTAGEVGTSAGPGELWAVSLAQLLGVGLLISGGVRLVAGRTRTLLPIAAGVQVALCAYWLLRGTDPLTPVVLTVLPLVVLGLGFRSANRESARSFTP